MATKLNPTKLYSTFISVGMLLLLNTAHGKGLDGICPKNVAEALKTIEKSLVKGNWVDIDIKSCLNIQDEIAAKAKQFIESGKSRKLIPLMSAETMQVYRNTVFASHGYVFKSEELTEHFRNFSWYKPRIYDPTKVALSEHEKKLVSLLKDIELKWANFCKNCYTNVEFNDGVLPRDVKLENNKIILKNKKQIDISPRSELPNASTPNLHTHISYTVNGFESLDSIMVCEYIDGSEFGGELIALSKLSLFAGDGALLNEVDEGSIFSSNCPLQPKSNPNISISLSSMGCCGATHDTLYVFNQSLEILSEQSVREEPIYLFETLAEQDLYYLTIEEISERSQKRVMDGVIYSLVKINKNGISELLSKKTTELLYKDGYFTSYGKYEHVNLYEQSKNFNNGRVAVALKDKKNIILFWLGGYTKPDGVTIIPIH